MKTKNVITVLFLFLTVAIIKAQTKTASVNDVKQIIRWMKDGKTQKIIFPAGTYNFSEPVSLENNNLVLEGSGSDQTILKLTSEANVLIDATGNNASLLNLTLDGGNNQKTFGNPIFQFNKSKGHHFENVVFTNSTRNAIGGSNGYATDGLVLKKCDFKNIGHMAIQIFNRNTKSRGGKVIEKVDKVIIDGCTFQEGYETAISSDNGNDREDSGDGTGRRYTESTSLSGTEIKNCVFEKSKKFHIAMVQSKDVIIQNNIFKGMTDDAGMGCQSIHMEQFTQNIEIYDNTFSMASTVSQPYIYILISCTEGHKRVTQQRASDTYASWTYNIKGSRERRASTACAKEGNTNKDCKRDVHAYGPRNIFIAGNTFNASPKLNRFVSIGEGENIQIGTKKNGTISLNDFKGGDAKTNKIILGGNDEGCGNVLIKAGQNVVASNVSISGVSFDLPPIRLKKPIVIEGDSK